MADSKFPAEEATIDSIQTAIREGEASALSVVDAYLARIDAYDRRGPALGSIISINENARA